MASAEARAKLARAAAALNARTPHLPALILMTDSVRLPDPVAAARALPNGSAVIVRHTDDGERAKLALALADVADERDLRLLVANDPELADAVDATGIHFAEARAGDAKHWRRERPGWLITAAAHSEDAVARATDVDAVLLSPIFATQSHPDRPPLGIERLRAIAANARVPIYALGGIGAGNVEQLADVPLAGIAAIGALAID